MLHRRVQANSKAGEAAFELLTWLTEEVDRGQGYLSDWADEILAELHTTAKAMLLHHHTEGGAEVLEEVYLVARWVYAVQYVIDHDGEVPEAAALARATERLLEFMETVMRLARER